MRGVLRASWESTNSPTARNPRVPKRLNDIDRKADMVPTVVYFVLAIILLGVIATPGFGAFALVVVPLAGLGLVWRIALTVGTHGRPSEAIVHTKPSHLLGPGAPWHLTDLEPLSARR